MNDPRVGRGEGSESSKHKIGHAVQTGYSSFNCALTFGIVEFIGRQDGKAIENTRTGRSVDKKDAGQDRSVTTCTRKLTAIKFSKPPTLDFFPDLDLLSAPDTRRRHDARRSDEIFMVLQ